MTWHGSRNTQSSMARYTGPRLRIVRRLDTALSGLTRKLAEHRRYPPGQHGPEAVRRRRRRSDYALRLQEKQKVRYYYGLTESQLRRYVSRATRRAEPPGDVLIRMLESRLDNVAFRLGLAPTIPAARQLVNHRHVLVNDKRVDVPSYETRPGEAVRLAARSREHPMARESAAQGPELRLPSYLEREADGLGGKVIAKPSREDTGLDFDEALVVEFYAR